MLSVVIPTLNAGQTLAASLAGLGDPARFGEIVVSDGGSLDDTLAVARAAGAQVVTGAQGRGPQLRLGAMRARGDWLLFVHADTRLSSGWYGTVVDHIGRQPGQAGYFRFALDDAAAPARRVERLTQWRCRILALPYGDQGILISRSLYDAVGGFNHMPLMEDVDLVRRIGRGRLTLLDCAAVTSAARYRRDGWWSRPIRNLAILTLWHLGVAPTRLVKLYR